jgi:hypothetical protein
MKVLYQYLKIIAPSKDLHKFIFILEALLHCVQPYPFLEKHWKIVTLGNEVYYSASATLYTFSLIRLYVCVKVIKYFNFYSNEKSKRIFKFFKNKKTNVFLYKGNIKGNGFLTLVFLLAVFLYVFSLIFKVYEDNNPERNSDFAELTNCLWYLVVTVTTSTIFNI